MGEVLIDTQEGIYYTVSFINNSLLFQTQPQKRGKPW
jgi:hypothetical protein